MNDEDEKDEIITRLKERVAIEQDVAIKLGERATELEKKLLALEAQLTSALNAEGRLRDELESRKALSAQEIQAILDNPPKEPVCCGYGCSQHLAEAIHKAMEEKK